VLSQTMNSVPNPWLYCLLLSGLIFGAHLDMRHGGEDSAVY
jgi:hypothetical protein